MIKIILILLVIGIIIGIIYAIGSLIMGIIGLIVYFFEEHPILAWSSVVGICFFIYLFILPEAFKPVAHIILSVLVIVLFIYFIYRAWITYYKKFLQSNTNEFNKKAKQILTLSKKLDKEIYYKTCLKDVNLSQYFKYSNYPENTNIKTILSKFFEEEKETRLKKHVLHLLEENGALTDLEIIQSDKNGSIKTVFPYTDTDFQNILTKLCLGDIEKIKLNNGETLFINKSSTGKTIKTTVIEM